MAQKIKAHEIKEGDRLMCAGRPEVTNVTNWSTGTCVTVFAGGKLFSYRPNENVGVERQAA